MNLIDISKYGLRIHLKSKDGLYMVRSYNAEVLNLATRKKEFSEPADEFKCIAGGFYNRMVPDVIIAQFYSVVHPQTPSNDELISLCRDMSKASEELEQNCNQEPEITEYQGISEELEDDSDYEYDEYLKFQIEQEEEMRNRTVEEWQKVVDDLAAEKMMAEDKHIKHLQHLAREVYADMDLSRFSSVQDKKFILLYAADTNSFRISFDPYGFLPNFHRDLKDTFCRDNERIAGGGWLKIDNDQVILYSKSSDYGSFDAYKAYLAAELIWDTKKVFIYPDKELHEL